MQDLTLTLIQRELAWEAPGDNREQIGTLIAALAESTDLIVLPEMFTTGFSMNAVRNAEEPGGPTEQWMSALARQHDCAVTGSIAVRVGDEVRNRMLFVSPQTSARYDKRHLFTMAGEHKRYSPGSERVITTWRGWRILLQVCYDLRFPVFSRSQADYDLALYVANWPDTRRHHWRQLLVARAIENQCIVAGVNRIGSDAKGLGYSGDSLLVDADGQLLIDLENKSSAATMTVSGADLLAYRERFPFLPDRDSFQLS
ncbi:MAG: amidohydrolase [Pseudomonadota bacterium]